MFLAKWFYDWAQNNFRYAYLNKLCVKNGVSCLRCYLKAKKRDTNAG